MDAPLRFDSRAAETVVAPLEDGGMCSTSIKRGAPLHCMRYKSRVGESINMVALSLRWHLTFPSIVRDAGKESCTLFKRLSVAADGKTSVVECRPLTGRTHQVRRSVKTMSLSNAPCFGHWIVARFNSLFYSILLFAVMTSSLRCVYLNHPRQKQYVDA